jgi:hypothetical protein
MNSLSRSMLFAGLLFAGLGGCVAENKTERTYPQITWTLQQTSIGSVNCNSTTSQGSIPWPVPYNDPNYKGLIYSSANNQATTNFNATTLAVGYVPSANITAPIEYSLFVHAMDTGGVQNLTLDITGNTLNAVLIPDPSGNGGGAWPNSPPLPLSIPQNLQHQSMTNSVGPDNQVSANATLIIAPFDWTFNIPSGNYVAQGGTLTLTATATNFAGRKTTSTLVLSPAPFQHP